jgi:hypothetical protein
MDILNGKQIETRVIVPEVSGQLYDLPSPVYYIRVLSLKSLILKTLNNASVDEGTRRVVLSINQFLTRVT